MKCPGGRGAGSVYSRVTHTDGIGMAVVIESLGHISNQIAGMQQCLSTLTGTVDELSSRTSELSQRVAALEESTNDPPPPKKRRVDIPISKFYC